MAAKKAQAARTKRGGKPRKAVEAGQPVSDWRADALAEVRKLLHEADPAIVEECKWVKPSKPAGVPVWSHAGIVCTGETYKQVVKLTFARGAALPDPQRLFNASLEGTTRRAIDIREGESLNAKAFKALVKAAVAENLRCTASNLKTTSRSAPVKLLSGGNPQIAKADGDAPVQAYIAAMPDWKHGIGKQLDTLIVQAVPNVIKAVKWNTPFYGTPGQGWFLAFHCITKYIKIAFFRGTSLSPLPPVESKQKDVRYLHVSGQEPLDEKQFLKWVKQAAALPGWKT